MQMSETNSKKRSNRLYRIREYLFDKGLSMADLGARIPNLSNNSIAYRVRVGDCLMEDMVVMAEKAGYKFVWHWEDVEPVDEGKLIAKASRPIKAFRSDLLKPVAKYLMRKGITTSELARRLGNISGPGITFRIREGVCMMSQMEEMAEAAGYKFVWSWEDVEGDKSDTK